MTSEQIVYKNFLEDIENLTHKTGNYKQFDIFTTMLKSGLLKTSESISLDLLTFDDLEALRSRRVMGQTSSTHTTRILPAATSNRRYLILTYTVEFDRIHYPLPMEYCGLPEPHVLQATIRRLEQEVIQLQEQLKLADNQVCDEELLDQVNILQRRVMELTTENEQLRSDIVRLSNQSNRKIQSQKHAEVLQKALTNLEEQAKKERTRSLHQLRNLKEEKALLMNQLEEFKSTEKSLRLQLRRALSRNTSQNCFIHSSRIDNFRKASPSRSVGDHRIHETPLTNGLKKRNNKRSPLPMSKSAFPLTHINRRSSSASSTEKLQPRHRSQSSQRSSSNESLHSVTNRNTGLNSKIKTKKILIADHSSSESSTKNDLIPKQNKMNCSRISLKNSRSNKDVHNDLRIHDLEKRISNLQQQLESDLTINPRNKYLTGNRVQLY